MEQDWRITGFPGSGLSKGCVPLSDSVAEHTDLCAALYTDNYDHLRAFSRGDSVVQMGRVLTIQHGAGLGRKILKEGIKQIREKMSPKQIYIEAQCYAIGYYEQEGFRVCSDEFLEDGIPHVQMILELQ